MVKIDGHRISCYDDFIKEIEKQLSFPRSCTGSIDRYLDWMRDLSWIKERSIRISIINSQNLTYGKNHVIIDDINELIIPFWTSDVTKYVVDGEPKHIVLELQ